LHAVFDIKRRASYGPDAWYIIMMSANSHNFCFVLTDKLYTFFYILVSILYAD